MKQIFDSMALELAKAAAEVAKLSFTMRSNLARWRKHREAAKCVEILVDAQKRCTEEMRRGVNNASRFRVKKGKKQ